MAVNRPHTPLQPPLTPRRPGPLRVLGVARISTDHQDIRSLADQEAPDRQFLDRHAGMPYDLTISPVRAAASASTGPSTCGRWRKANPTGTTSSWPRTWAASPAGPRSSCSASCTRSGRRGWSPSTTRSTRPGRTVGAGRVRQHAARDVQPGHVQPHQPVPEEPVPGRRRRPVRRLRVRQAGRGRDGRRTAQGAGGRSGLRRALRQARRQGVVRRGGRLAQREGCRPGPTRGAAGGRGGWSAGSSTTRS